MKRSFLLRTASPVPLVAAGAGLIAATYGLVRMAFGLFLPDVQADLGLDVAAAGGVSAGASVVYCAGALLGFLTATRHARRLIVVAGLTASIGALGMALAPTSFVFAVFAIASSAGAGLASPALVAVLQRNPSTARNPRHQAIVNAGTGPGVILAGALALLLAPDWRLAWALAAVVTVVAAVGVLVSDRSEADAVAPPPALPPLSWFAAHQAVLAAAFLLGVGSAAVWTYGRTFLIESGTSGGVSMAAWIALGVGGTAVIVTARWSLRPRAAWVVTAAAVTASTAGVLAGGGWALVAFAVFGWGYTAGSGVLIAWTAQIDAARAPAGTALLFVTLILGQAVGAAGVGAAIPVVGYAAAFAGAAVVTAVAVTPALGRVVRGGR
ncbi:MFS transporter [Microbacterium sp. P06]|uniref:MFS transporter n=1 Tax=Microbacterium sp. P06 TaxID=3366949 RepID=UPI003744CA8B